VRYAIPGVCLSAAVSVPSEKKLLVIKEDLIAMGEAKEKAVVVDWMFVCAGMGMISVRQQ
jgi:hypothetical protein